MASVQFSAGDRVLLHGLSAAAYNQQPGRVKGPAAVVGRWEVELLGEQFKKKSIAVKAENLKLVPTPQIVTLNACKNPGCKNVEDVTNFVKKFKKCSQCKTNSYCSRECQLAHWKNGHKEVCGKSPSKDMKKRHNSLMKRIAGDMEMHSKIRGLFPKTNAAGCVLFEITPAKAEPFGPVFVSRKDIRRTRDLEQVFKQFSENPDSEAFHLVVFRSEMGVAPGGHGHPANAKQYLIGTIGVPKGVPPTTPNRSPESSKGPAVSLLCDSQTDPATSTLSEYDQRKLFAKNTYKRMKQLGMKRSEVPSDVKAQMDLFVEKGVDFSAEVKCPKNSLFIRSD